MADQKKVVFEYLEALLMDPDAGKVTDKVSTEEDKPSKESELVEKTLDTEEVQLQTGEPEPEPEPEGLRCILVDVHGLKLAIPMSEVDGAQEISSLTMSIDLHHDWIIGNFGPEGNPIHVVDTGRWVIPETYSVDQAAYSDILILKGRKWALACNQIIKSVDLPDNEVNLNLDKERRAWLHGTCLKQRCAVLDTNQLLDEFEVMII